ncbi:hypothetical protein OAQ99_00460 [Candidatus Kapabacteria bacterium]|nr:hypothetical protein [Candidatus Kapabacteria bacterium]
MKKYILSIIITITLSACSTRTNMNGCPEETLDGSINVNSQHSEIDPIFFNGNLYFTQEYLDDDNYSEILKLSNPLSEDNKLVKITELDFPDLKIIGTPSYYNNLETGFLEVYFSAINTVQNNKNKDIYFAYGNEFKFNYPTALNEINSDFNESMPKISNDGKTLVYVSDSNYDLTGSDIYLTTNTDGKWNPPILMSDNINSKYDELYPNISPEGDLYFVSNGYTDLNNYDLIKAEKKGYNYWSYGQLLPYPFNTEYDEQGFDFDDREIYISSNRAGGCGNYDLFNFQRCRTGKVILNISSINSNYKPVGKLEIYSEDRLISVLQIDDNGTSLDLTPGNYYFEFTSKCLSNGIIKENFTIPCDEEYEYEYNLDISIPEPQIGNFSFEEYNIPFFVGGYFIPNTSKNLENLKLKFKYNQMDADSVSFVENPKNEYDESSLKVDEALSKALDFLQTKVDNLASECSNSQEIVKVQVVGFSDPRPLAKNSKYFGPTINDKYFNFNAPNGISLDNKLLSKLRAYYTAKYFENELKKNPNYSSVSFRFVWEIRGLGVDPYKGTTYDFNRRVKISIESVIN